MRNIEAYVRLGKERRSRLADRPGTRRQADDLQRSTTGFYGIPRTFRTHLVIYLAMSCNIHNEFYCAPQYSPARSIIDLR